MDKRGRRRVRGIPKDGEGWRTKARRRGRRTRRRGVFVQVRCVGCVLGV